MDLGACSRHRAGVSDGGGDSHTDGSNTQYQAAKPVAAGIGLRAQVAALERDAEVTKGSMEDTLMGIEHDITETNKEIKEMKDENTMLRNRMYETLMQESKGLVTAVLKEVKEDGLKETQQLLARMETFNIALLGKQDYIDKHSEQLGDVAEVLLKLQRCAACRCRHLRTACLPRVPCAATGLCVGRWGVRRETQQCLLTKADHQEITKLKKHAESAQELKSQEPICRRAHTAHMR